MPDLLPILNSLAWPFAITLAWLAGEFGQRWTGLPRISFYGLVGFLLAAPLAMELGLGFVMLRKRGKLPGETVGLDYALEYGTDRIEIQADAVRPGDRVVILDDLLATGGTMSAGIQLLRKVGAEVPAAAAMVELTFLGGRDRLGVPCEVLVSYDV